MGPLVIRLPSPQVSAARLEILFETLRDDPLFHPHDLGAAGAGQIATYLGKDVYVVLESGGELIGYGMLRGWDEGYAVPSLGIAIRPDHRRSGYGRVLMLALHDVARATGATQIRLRVSPENGPAAGLYWSLGYRDAGEERGERVLVLELAPGDQP